jgi:branched-chain amino acid transport system ATP-binding protein
MSILLETKDLTKNFGGLIAVNNVNFKLHRGELRSIIGPNGAGKTTFFNLITGVLKPTKGKVFFEGQDITNLPPHIIARRGIGRSFQISNLFNELTVFENIRLSVQVGYGKIYTLKSVDTFTDVIRRTEEILKLLGLTEKKDIVVKNLSHGERRLVEVGIALGLKPKLLALDEPTAGLSAKETETFIEVIKRIRKEVSSILFISHDIDTVMNISDTISVMFEGRIIAEGPPKEIESNDKVQEVYLRRR